MGMQRNNLNKFVRALRCFSNEYKFLLNENIPQEELIVGFFDGKYYVGRTKQDVPEMDGLVYIKKEPLDRTDRRNHFVTCKIVGISDYDLVAEIID